MANIKQARKRVGTIEKKRAQNAAFKSELRTTVKVFEKKADQNDVAGAKEAFSNAVKKIDKAVNRGIFHKNTAARQKSRMHKRLNELSA
ncbi:30S ribosomal protein S20 [Salisediminibacterium halotolerans]|uniref:Small ribosomal subunit protein bS20 n=1 Tax=Salisediminibacterium halotolerans TaxID=517425 RepID=A0A1H9S637_9BACI|nr:30S ribosomal protein S20 [Salisediminibacterium haloalkalitolerans]SER80085.1 small subunit ribosomal protein S20 [Salisediminibacterium haloalkalitolerans]